SSRELFLPRLRFFPISALRLAAFQLSLSPRKLRDWVILRLYSAFACGLFVSYNTGSTGLPNDRQADGITERFRSSERRSSTTFSCALHWRRSISFSFLILLRKRVTRSFPPPALSPIRSS